MFDKYPKNEILWVVCLFGSCKMDGLSQTSADNIFCLHTFRAGSMRSCRNVLIAKRAVWDGISKLTVAQPAGTTFRTKLTVSMTLCESIF
jgi:hypothetical protein